MKNYPVVKSYVINFDDFDELVTELFVEDITVEYDFESVYIIDSGDSLPFDEVVEKLSDYFYVEVTSLHCDENSVWVSFK